MAQTFIFLIQHFYKEDSTDVDLPLKNNLSMEDLIRVNIKLFYNRPLEFKDNIIRQAFYQFLFFKEVGLKKFIDAKFNLYKQGFTNMFFNHEIREMHIDKFNKIQKVYRGMCKLAYVYKLKKAQIQVSTDLYMNELDPTARNVFTLFDGNRKYLFTISDLVNMFYTSLCNAPYFIPSPVACKNPYNNTPFTKANLYNIYFFIAFNKIKVPEIVRKYFMCHFNLKRFRNENRRLIHDHAITRYVNNSPVSNLRASILEMIFEHNVYKKKLRIHSEFPPDLLLKIMRPYLLLYYKSKFSCRRYLNQKYYNVLAVKMKEFIKYNPNFGRKSSPFAYNPHHFGCPFDQKHIKYEMREEEYDIFHKSHLAVDAESDTSDDELDFSEDDNL